MSNILSILNKYCVLDDNRQIKYIYPSSIMNVNNEIEMFITEKLEKAYEDGQKDELDRCGNFNVDKYL